MAKLARKDPEHAEDDVIDITPTDLGENYTDPMDALLSAFDAGSGEERITARVYRVTGAARDGVEQPFLFSITSHDIEGVQERLRDEFGTGKYFVRVFHNGKLHRIVPYSVEAPKKPVEPKGSDMAEVLKAIQASNEAMWARMESTLAQRTPVVSVDPLAMLEKITTIFKNMAPAGASVQQQGPSMDAVFNLVERGMEIGQSMTRGGDNDSVMGMIKEVVVEVAKQPAFGAMLAGFLNRGPMGQPPAALEAPPQQPQAQPDALKAQQEFAHTLTYLADKAKQGKDVGLYVDWFLDQYPPDFTGQLFANPALLDNLCTVHPGVKEHREWFGRFIDLARGPVPNVTDGDAPPEDDGADDGHTNPTHGDA